MEWYVDESGNDETDVAFHVVGSEAVDLGVANRQYLSLRADWPVFSEAGLKAATAGSPGWLALRWLTAHPQPLPPGRPVTLHDLYAFQFNRRRFPLLLEAAVSSRSVSRHDLSAAADAGELRLSPLDLRFADWACAVREAARHSPPPPGDGLGVPALPAISRWYKGLRLHTGLYFPILFRQSYLDAMLSGQGTAVGTSERPAGDQKGELQRYLNHLDRIIEAARAAGVRRLRIQGRHVPQPAAQGTPLAGVLRPLTADHLRARGADGLDIVIESFWQMADARIGHRIADAAAYTFRRNREAGAFSVTTLAVTR